MLTTLVVVAACIWVVSLRADRIHAGRVTEPEAPRVSERSASGSVTLYRGQDAKTWARRYRHRTHQLQAARAQLRHAWKPVDYALRLASVVFGVSERELSTVAYCESHHFTFAQNGIYRGLFQEGPMFERHRIGQAGFSVYDPVANALVAASTVSREGWRQWQCRP